MSDWTCKRCGAINLEGQRACEACGGTAAKPAPPVAEGYQRLEMPAERPCTQEQNKAAYRVVQDVLQGRCDAAEGRQRLSRIFAMPELTDLQ